MFTSLKNKIKEETGNDVCATLPAFSSHRRNSLSLNNFNNNNNIIATNTFSHQSKSDVISISNSVNSKTITTKTDPSDSESEASDDIGELLDKLNGLESKLTKLSNDYNEVRAVKKQLEESNGILEGALKVAQEQKELIYSEQDKIQNLQAQEICKLKSLLHFREQVSINTAY